MKTSQTKHHSQKAALAKAYALFLDARTPLSQEMILIRSMFFSLEAMEEFDDDAVYLSFLKNLISERQNISFPEESALSRKYFRDCITLKNLEESLQGFNLENYLSETICLIENLKTPYYDTYFQSLISLKSTFTDSNLLSRTLQDFYGIMIKSPARLLAFVRRIAAQGPLYKSMLPDEEMVRGLLLSNLAVFAKEDPDVSIRMLDDYLEKEKVFFHDFLQARGAEAFSLTEFLAERTLFMEDHAGAKIGQMTGERPLVQKVDSEFLNHYGYNMNSRSYLTNPAIGREAEIQDLCLVLISPKKSPILIGQAGVGKTSVVEGLAYALKHGKVPALLKDKIIFKLTTTALLSGTKYVGEMEERMKKLMDELEAHPEVILFIDEIHTIVGAGSTESSNNDISNMLKPYIDRGEIKLIGATTSEEYHRFIKYDQALSRRFYPILVEEADREMCLKILYETIPSISYETGVHNPFSKEETLTLLKKLLTISSPENQPEDLRTHWPELPLSLLEMAFSYAALYSRPELSVEDFILAVSHSNRLNKAVKSAAKELISLKEDGPDDPVSSI